jgi:hypothetical protein
LSPHNTRCTPIKWQCQLSPTQTRQGQRCASLAHASAQAACPASAPAPSPGRSNWGGRQCLSQELPFEGTYVPSADVPWTPPPTYPTPPRAHCPLSASAGRTPRSRAVGMPLFVAPRAQPDRRTATAQIRGRIWPPHGSGTAYWHQYLSANTCGPTRCPWIWCSQRLSGISQLL